MTTEAQRQLFKFFLVGMEFAGALLFLGFAWLSLALANTPFLAVFVFGYQWVAYLLPIAHFVIVGYFIRKGIRTLMRTDDFGIKGETTWQQ